MITIGLGRIRLSKPGHFESLNVLPFWWFGGLVVWWIVDCGLWIVDCGLWIVDCGLWIVD
ncbi:MAG: hypothetical protein GQ574_12420 [Crocinitomix sp.]|nr:hypothetical protein [Crocinitomix sp.]